MTIGLFIASGQKKRQEFVCFYKKSVLAKPSDNLDGNGDGEVNREEVQDSLGFKIP